MERTFDLQLFADDVVELDTLKEHFSDEELKTFLPPETTATPELTPEPLESAENVEITLETEQTPEPIEPEQSVSDNDKVSKHVPYDRFKEVNERNKLLAAELAALKEQAKQQPVQQQPTQQQSQPVQQQDIASQIKDFAKQQAIKKLGIEGSPQDLMFADPEKYEDYIAERARVEYEEINKYNQQQQVYNENVNFVRELQAIPDFPVLFQFAERELDELPRKEARKIDDAYSRIDAGRGTTNDFNVIREFANKCREKMTGIQNTPPIQQDGFSTPTPQTSPLDKAAGLPRAQNLSGAKTSAMSWAQVEQLIRDGKADQIPPEMLKQIDPRLV